MSTKNQPAQFHGLKKTSENVALHQDLLEYVVMRMASRYGHRWTSQFGDEVDGIAASEWRSTLGNLTLDQIEHGFEFDRQRAEGWPPASTEFAAWCRGIPSAHFVLSELLSPQFRDDPFLRKVWSKIDTWAFRQANQTDARRLIMDAYEHARNEVMFRDETLETSMDLLEFEARRLEKTKDL